MVNLFWQVSHKDFVGIKWIFPKNFREFPFTFQNNYPAFFKKKKNYPAFLMLYVLPFFI
jgi:hypothetical protein